jgi:hypothetical protein
MGARVFLSPPFLFFSRTIQVVVAQKPRKRPEVIFQAIVTSNAQLLFTIAFRVQSNKDSRGRSPELPLVHPRCIT